jgi:DNA-binding MarR family transcriptional regulator
MDDINRAQGLMLFNIGDAEMSVGELAGRVRHLTSNPWYNIRKMVEKGYLTQDRSARDGRIVLVRLTEKKGAKLRDRLQQMHQRHVEILDQAAITDEDLHAATVTLGALDGFWTGILDFKAVAA